MTAALVLFAGEAAASPAVTDLNLEVAQSGAESGIRNRVFSTWLPAGQGFAGLDGRISLAGNAPGFSEALVLLGTSPDDRESCPLHNGMTVAGIPAWARLWAGILKSDGVAQVGIPVSLRLPHAVPPTTPSGTCLLTLISAGYPFLRRDAALYTDTVVQLRVVTAPAPAQPVQTFGIGGEFRFPLAVASGAANYVGIQANRPLALDAIAVSLSAAPVAKAPRGSGWGAALSGTWQISTAFLYVPASACLNAGLTSRRPGLDYNVLRLGTPAAIPRPVGAVTLFDAELAGRGMEAAQHSGSVEPEPTLRLAPGDCLVAFTSVPPSGTAGQIDAENQSTLYLRPTR